MNAAHARGDDVDDHAERVPYIALCQAGRAAFSAAMAAEVTHRQLRVLVAVVNLTVLWSRLEDEISPDQLAEEAAIPGNADTRNRAIRRDLKRLVGLGIVTYTPGRGKGHVSLVGLPVLVTQKGAATDPLLDDTKGGRSGIAKGGRLGSQKGADPRTAPLSVNNPRTTTRGERVHATPSDPPKRSPPTTTATKPPGPATMARRPWQPVQLQPPVIDDWERARGYPECRKMAQRVLDEASRRAEHPLTPTDRRKLAGWLFEMLQAGHHPDQLATAAADSPCQTPAAVQLELNRKTRPSSVGGRNFAGAAARMMARAP